MLTDCDIESDPGPTQNDFKSPVGRPKKIKVFKRTTKKCDLTVKRLMLLVIQRYRIFFQYNSTSQPRHY